MFNKKSPLTGTIAGNNIKRDSTRILAQLSGNSSVVPARVKRYPLRNVILISFLISLTGLVAVGAATSLFKQRGDAQQTKPFATQTDLPTKASNSLALSAPSESQAAHIVNVPTMDDANKSEVTVHIAAAATVDRVSAQTNPQSKTVGSSILDESASKADQKRLNKSTASVGVQKSQNGQKTNDDSDVNLIAALLQSTKSSMSAK